MNLNCILALRQLAPEIPDGPLWMRAVQSRHGRIAGGTNSRPEQSFARATHRRRISPARKFLYFCRAGRVERRECSITGALCGRVGRCRLLGPPADRIFARALLYGPPAADAGCGVPAATHG